MDTADKISAGELALYILFCFAVNEKLPVLQSLTTMVAPKKRRGSFSIGKKIKKD